jgi:hypothetical protein
MNKLVVLVTLLQKLSKYYKLNNCKSKIKEIPKNKIKSSYKK